MKLYKDFKVIIFILAMLFALAAIYPGYSPQSGLSSNLQYGLDLEGGTRLQLELQGAIAGIAIDPAVIIEKEYSDALGAIEITESSDDEVIFKTTEPLEKEEIDTVGYGSAYVRDNEVTLSINRDYVVEKYLSKCLDTEVIRLGGGMYEIRSTVNESELSDVLADVGGSITKDIQGNLEFKKTVTKDTQKLTEDVLNEKLNLWGLKEVTITPVEDNLLMVDLAGIDLTTAMDIVATPGKFEIRIHLTNNTTSHVVWGEHITAVDMPKMHDGSWGVGFTVDAVGAKAIRDAAVETGAVDDPAAHELTMLLDDGEIYSAPLAPALADNLRDLYDRGENLASHTLTASTGGGDEGQVRAEQLYVHLRAGALPVEVAVIGSWQVPASLGAKFKEQTVIAGLFALLTVALVIFGRYGRKKILIPMVATSASEVFMILGFAALANWQLDLPAIAGIIAVIGTGIDHLVIITDEVLYEGKMPSLKVYLARIGKAFAIIFAAATTTIIAMAPLIAMSFGALKGFAITTIVGVLIGVLIARPAYGRVIKDLLE
ncbi:MAG: preprotein translocase subunit SecD [Euryarchaeota archaeon]|nr:MAG: Protein-export membrane protein SecD [ANME-2 cluster archaeon]MEA1864013.1 preprotein translocase subunit SecD [Euryarchaeota archaeon]